MNDFPAAIARIRAKLPLAREADSGFKVFGAESHRYVLHPPASAEAVAEFETRCGIALPEGYRQFLLHVGNGGGAHEGAGAGPFYGIYPLGTGADEVASDDSLQALARPCVMQPRMSKACWTALDDGPQGNSDVDGLARQEAHLRRYGGVLALGSQGCLNVHGLVLNGPHAGRVVNLDLDSGHPPVFTHEPDFLAWYERWLDEVIAGDLFEQPSWFGYVPGGLEARLLADFRESTDEGAAQEFLSGLLAKRQLASATLDTLLELEPASAPQRATICQIVCKSDHEKARSLLAELARTDALAFFRCLHWHARDKVPQWESVILSLAPRIADDETFSFFTYVLERLPVDRGAILAPFTRSERSEIRASAFYALGKVANRVDHLDSFIVGLKDADNTVVRNTLQALAGLKERALVAHYRELAARFPEERDYILVNLDRRFKELGLSRLDAARAPVAASIGERFAAAWRRWRSP